MSEVLSKVTCDHIPEGDSCGLVVTLIEQNAKLRELALDFYDAIDSVFWDGETETKERFKPRLRELGVEVEHE